MSANDLVYILVYEDGTMYPYLFDSWQYAEVVQAKLPEKTTLEERYLDLLEMVNKMKGFEAPKVTFTEMMEKHGFFSREEA